MGQQWRVPIQLAGVILITLAAFNGVMATVAETCTMNAADTMLAGFLNLPLYVLGFAAIVVFPLSRWSWVLIAPAITGMGYHLIWTARFAYHYLVMRGGVCELITGDGPWAIEGREPIYLSLWIVLSVMTIAGTIWAGRRTLARY